MSKVKTKKQDSKVDVEIVNLDDHFESMGMPALGTGLGRLLEMIIRGGDDNQIENHKPVKTKREISFEPDDRKDILHFIDHAEINMAEEAVDFIIKRTREMNKHIPGHQDKLICGGCVAAAIGNMAMVFAQKAHLTITEAGGFYGTLGEILIDKAHSAAHMQRAGHGEDKLGESPEETA